jgi:hypothetical protein
MAAWPQLRLTHPLELGSIASCNGSAKSNTKPSPALFHFPLAMGSWNPVNRSLLRKNEQNVEMQGTEPAYGKEPTPPTRHYESFKNSDVAIIFTL